MALPQVGTYMFNSVEFSKVLLQYPLSSDRSDAALRNSAAATSAVRAASGWCGVGTVLSPSMLVEGVRRQELLRSVWLECSTVPHHQLHVWLGDLLLKAEQNE